MSTISFSARGDAIAPITLRPGDSVALAFTVAEGSAFDGVVQVRVGQKYELSVVEATVTDETSFTVRNNGAYDTKLFCQCRSIGTESDPISASVTVTRKTNIQPFSGSQIVDQDGNVLLGLTPTAVAAPAALTVAGVANIVGRTTFEDEVQVAGDVLLTSALDVSGTATFGDDVTAESALQVDGQLDVSASAVFASDIIAEVGVYVSGVLDVDGSADFAATITAGDTDQYGFVHRTGLYDDLVVSLVGVNPPGSEADPGIDLITGIPMFDKAAVETLPFETEVLHRWKSGTPIKPHLHCMADIAADPIATVIVTLDDAVWDPGAKTLTTSAGNFSDLPLGAKFAIGYASGTETVEIGTYTVAGTGTDVITIAETLNSESGSNYHVRHYADNVVIGLEYKILDAASGSWDQTSYTQVFTTGRLAPHAATGVAQEVMVIMEDLDMSGHQDSVQIVGRLSRHGDSALDTYDNDLHMHHMDFHYKVNTMGSLGASGEDF